MAVNGGEVAVKLGNSRVEFPPSLSNRWELIGTLPAFILSKSHQKSAHCQNLHLRDRGTFSLIFDVSEHPPPYAVF